MAIGSSTEGDRAAFPGLHTRRRYVRKALLRAVLRTVLRPLVSWKPLDDPKSGYTILIGCAHRLTSMLWANLALLNRLDTTGCDRVLIAIDCLEGELGVDLEARAREVAPNLRVHFIYYTPFQKRVTRVFDWGWIYCWLNWCLAIRDTRTRYGFIHDFDALLLKPDVIRKRWEMITREDAQFIAHRFYVGHGFNASDELGITWEMIFDAQYLRANFRPIQLFNRMARHKGRLVEFDTFLEVQSKGARTLARALDDEDLVHPTEVIVTFVDFNAGRHSRTPDKNNLLMIPYYNSVADDTALLDDLATQMEAGNGTVKIWGRPLDVTRMGWVHADWLRQLAYRVEHRVFGKVRANVKRFFDALVALNDDGRQDALIGAH
jgi:hypothetical protein